MINTALLKEQLKRFWSLSALLFTYYTLTIILPIYIDILDGRGHSELASLINMRNEFMILSILFAPAIVVIVLFKFQNQVNSALAMHLYPITKNQLLITNAFAGIVLLLLPLLAFCIIMIFPIHQFYYDLFFLQRSTFVPIVPVYQQFGVLLNSIFVISRFFLITALSFLFFLSLYMISAMMSGNSMITLLLYFTLFLLIGHLHELAITISRLYVFGFFRHSNMNNFIRPTLLSNWVRDGSMLFPMILYSIIIVAMTVCMMFISNKRVQERVGGKLIVFPYAKQAMVFIVSVGGLLLFSVLSGMFAFWSVTAMNIGFAIILFISYCTSKMISAKTFNILNKMKDFINFAAVAISILLLIIVSIRFDIFGYERYVPLAKR